VFVPVAALAALFFLVVVRAAMRMRHREVITRDETLVGREGVAVRDLDPRGVVQVAAENWTADSTGGLIVHGERVRVVAVDGLRLRVEPVVMTSAEGPPEDLGAAGVATSSAEGRTS
jgi:membrane-bound serine protease (ClpP class)